MNRAGVTALTLVAAFSLPLHAQTSSDEVGNWTAAELAASYRDLKQIEGHLGGVEGGMTLEMPGVTVTRDNLEQFSEDLSRRLALVSDAIVARGFADAAGEYGTEATSACKKIPSGWAQGIAGGSIGRVTISQAGFRITLAQQFKHEGDSIAFEIEGVIVGSTLAFDDMMNSDFGLVGEAGSAVIIIRPDVEQILAAWPEWIEAPSRKDLSRCEVRLVRHIA